MLAGLYLAITGAKSILALGDNAINSDISMLGELVGDFWQDFSIADRFGINGIKSTFIRAFREWKSNYKYLTELSMVLNHKIGYFYDHEKPMDARCNRIAALYSELWEQVNDYAYDNGTKAGATISGPVAARGA